ncbi:MAG: LemA family protein [Bacilli bacterium]
MIHYILSAIVLISLGLIYYIYLFNKFQDCLVRLEEATLNITSLLNKKFDLLNKAVEVMKTQKKIKEEPLKKIAELTIRQADDNALNQAFNEFNIITIDNPQLLKNKTYHTFYNSLNDTEEQLIALKKYYNNILITYNKLVRCWPTKIVAIIKAFKEKEFYDSVHHGLTTKNEGE